MMVDYNRRWIRWLLKDWKRKLLFGDAKFILFFNKNPILLK